jgi:HK97 family phage major capsid protein
VSLVKDLRKQKAAALDELNAIADAAKKDGRGMTAEEVAKFDEVEARIKGIDESITRAEKLDRLNEERGAATTSAVDIQVIRNEHEDENGNPKVWGSFGEQLQAIIHVEKNPHGAKSRELREKIQLTNQMMAAATGMNESVGADGGVFVQKDFASEIVENGYQEAPFASQVRRLPLSTSANGIKIPYVDESSRVDGSRQGGVQMYWEGEADDITASKPKFGLMELNTKKIVGAAYLTEEIIADAAFLGAWVSQAFSNELAFKLDDAFINGNGAGKPLGILQNGALVTVAKESSQSAAGIVAQNITKMFSRLLKRNRGSSIWLYNQSCEAELMSLPLTIGSNSYPVLIMGGVTGTIREEVATDRILGRPAYASEHCAAMGTVGDIIFTDPKSYIAVDKGGPKQAVSVHVRFLQDEQVLKFTYRVDGQPARRTALTPYKGASTLSSTVVVATRP